MPERKVFNSFAIWHEGEESESEKLAFSAQFFSSLHITFRSVREMFDEWENRSLDSLMHARMQEGNKTLPLRFQCFSLSLSSKIHVIILCKRKQKAPTGFYYYY